MIVFWCVAGFVWTLFLLASGVLWVGCFGGEFGFCDG